MPPREFKCRVGGDKISKIVGSRMLSKFQLGGELADSLQFQEVVGFKLEANF